MGVLHKIVYNIDLLLNIVGALIIIWSAIVVIRTVLSYFLTMDLEKIR